MVVFDTSTLILLAKIQLLRLISENIDVHIPRIVEGEATIKDTFDAKLIRQIINEGKITVAQNPPQKEINAIQRDFPMAPAEAAALVMDRKKDTVLATDDGVTIKACKILNVKFTTAIHFLIHACTGGRLQKELALSKLDKLVLYGRYSTEIIEDATKRIKGEGRG